MTEAIKATQGRAAVYFSNLRHDHGNKNLTYWDLCDFKINRPFSLKQEAGEWALMQTQPMMFQASVLQRKTYFEIGGLPLDLKTREDTYLFLKLGLNYPLCAVSHCGTIIGSDAKERLTQRYNRTGSLTFWNATIFIYKKLLRQSGNLKPDHYHRLRRSLSNAHLCTGRKLLRNSRCLDATTHLIKSFCVSPSYFFKEIIASIKRYLRTKINRHTQAISSSE
jgi:hypothetical protein